MGLTIKDLKEAIQNLPDNMPVGISEPGFGMHHLQTIEIEKASVEGDFDLPEDFNADDKMDENEYWQKALAIVDPCTDTLMLY